MTEITIHNSTITGLHATKKSCHSTIALNVVPDSTGKDPDAMKVVVPGLESLKPESLDLITWPKNPMRKRYIDQLVRDVAGQKIGNVPANLCGAFKELLNDGHAVTITARATAEKPRASTKPPTKQSFQKRSNGLDRRGGGVLDCIYTLHSPLGFGYQLNENLKP